MNYIFTSKSSMRTQWPKSIEITLMKPGRSLKKKNNKERCVSSSSTFVIFFCSLLFGLAYFCADRNSIRQSSIYLFEIEENEHTYCVPIGLTIFVVCLFVFTLASPFFSFLFFSPFILSLCARFFLSLFRSC